MRKLEWGRIICLASVAAKQPLPGLILSTTARAGVLGFAKALADEVAAEGITVNVVCPGFIATERDRKSTRLNSSHITISYAVFCLKKKKHSSPSANDSAQRKVSSL